MSEMQRRRLLSAMIGVVFEGGLEGATVGRVCKRAGVSRRTFYDLFDDLETCFVDACETASEHIATHVAPAYANGGSWRERVRAGLAALLGLLDEEPGVARVLLVETWKGAPPTLDLRRRMFGALTRIVDQGRKEGGRNLDPSSVIAESTVGGAVAVVHARLVERDPRPLLELLGPLTSMIVLPYLGPAAARKELHRPVPPSAAAVVGNGRTLPLAAPDPFKDLPIRLTFRTVRVLGSIATHPNASNREIGKSAGVADQGQMSKLLHRLQNAKLIENQGEGQARGERNAWHLTPKGHDVLHAIGAGDAA